MHVNYLDEFFLLAVPGERRENDLFYPQSSKLSWEVISIEISHSVQPGSDKQMLKLAALHHNQIS